MDIATVITLLTVNLIVLSVVIIALIVATTILLIKMNKIAANVQQTTENLAHATNWFSPMKLFAAVAHAVRVVKKR
jgi:hypothetical protein